MSNVGDRKNAGKPRWRNFPLFLVEPLINVGSAAEKHPGNPEGKYDTYNFLKGMKVDDCLDCAKRHLMKAESPFYDDYDEETKVHHLAHAAWNCLVALHNIKTRPDLDDRYKIRLNQLEQKMPEKSDGVSLHNAAEKAQEQVAALVKFNKETIFNVTKAKVTFPRGEIVKHLHNDVEVIVEATYFDENGKEVLFVKDPSDPESKTVGVDPTFYKSIYKEKEV